VVPISVDDDGRSPLMQLTAWGHAGVRLERGDRRLVIDPGSFTDPAILDGADAVLVTHEHPDHVVPEQLVGALGATGSLEVWCPGSVTDLLVDAGAPPSRVHAVDAGEDFVAAGFDVRALGGEHALIHPDLPPVANLAYLVEQVVLHPGDSFTPPPAGTVVEVLLLPVGAPWLKLAESVEYVRTVAPQVAVPIHDGTLTDAGKALADRVVGGLVGSVGYRRLVVGDALTVDERPPSSGARMSG
jgi:L-ascorbate metabolism protein UlaG (beta-lactamase superfamily)